jgi:hypothetical protein
MHEFNPGLTLGRIARKVQRLSGAASMDRLNSHVVDDLLLLAQHTEIVHHIPGRIRLRVTRSGVRLAATIDVPALLQAIPGIRQVRVNPVVGSVMVEYDAQRLPFPLWEKLGKLKSDASLHPQLKRDLESLS